MTNFFVWRFKFNVFIIRKSRQGYSYIPIEEFITKLTLVNFLEERNAFDKDCFKLFNCFSIILSLIKFIFQSTHRLLSVSN